MHAARRVRELNHTMNYILASCRTDGPFQSVSPSHGSTFEQNITGPSFWYALQLPQSESSQFKSFLQGVFICVLGLGLLVCSDQLTGKNYEPISRGKGDALMIAGATLYGFSKGLF